MISGVKSNLLCCGIVAVMMVGAIGSQEQKSETTRSRDYDLSVIELQLNNDKDKSMGTLIPGGRAKMNKKKNEVELESYHACLGGCQGSWKDSSDCQIAITAITAKI